MSADWPLLSAFGKLILEAAPRSSRGMRMLERPCCGGCAINSAARRVAALSVVLKDVRYGIEVRLHILARHILLWHGPSRLPSIRLRRSARKAPPRHRRSESFQASSHDQRVIHVARTLGKRLFDDDCFHAFYFTSRARQSLYYDG